MLRNCADISKETRGTCQKENGKMNPHQNSCMSTWYILIRTHVPLEDALDPLPTVSEGISLLVGVWESLGYLPRVCGQNH